MPTILPPGRTERALRAAAYLATSGIGLSVILDPPVLNSVLGSGLTFAWALCVMTALPCVPACLRARYRTEYVLLPIFTTALLVSVVALWVKFSLGVIDYTLPRVLMATALVLLFAGRFWSLHRIVKTMEAAPWTGSRQSQP